MERTEKKHGVRRWNKWATKMIAIAVFLMAGLFVTTTHAQTSLSNAAPVHTTLDKLLPGSNYSFVSPSQAVTIVKQELGIIGDQQANQNGGSAEVESSFKAYFYNSILEDVAVDVEVETSIVNSYNRLLVYKNNFRSSSVNTEAILNEAVGLLSE